MEQVIEKPARAIAANPLAAGMAVGEASTDRIEWIKLSLVSLPLAAPISDAKVLTGRQKPLTEIAFLFCEIGSKAGHEGIGFSYSKRAGGPGQFVHAREIAPELLGEDPNDIARLWDKLVWAGASVGRSGLSTQAIAAFDIALWDMKAKRAGLPLAKLLGAHRDSVRCYNTSGGYLSMPIEQVLDNIAQSLDSGIGGIKIKVGQPDPMVDLKRVEAVHKKIGGRVAMMVDANQQWDRVTAQRVGRILEQFNLTWIEEPLDAYDAEGHAMLAAQLDTPIATGEMLTSVAEHYELIRNNSVDFIQPDAPRVGGITPFLKICALADHRNLRLAPHYVMEIHLHLTAAYAREPWVEHFEWSEPMFNERLQIRDGRMIIPNRPGLGFSLSEQARAWTRESAEFGKRA
jgi:L-talarate/galactarate dehydratase